MGGHSRSATARWSLSSAKLSGWAYCSALSGARSSRASRQEVEDTKSWPDQALSTWMSSCRPGSGAGAWLHCLLLPGLWRVWVLQSLACWGTQSQQSVLGRARHVDVMFPGTGEGLVCRCMCKRACVCLLGGLKRLVTNMAERRRVLFPDMAISSTNKWSIDQPL